jgi:hypothetical protein
MADPPQVIVVSPRSRRWALASSGRSMETPRTTAPQRAHDLAHPTPPGSGDGEDLRLMRRGTNIRCDRRRQLMNNRPNGSEEIPVPWPSSGSVHVPRRGADRRPRHGLHCGRRWARLATPRSSWPNSWPVSSLGAQRWATPMAAVFQTFARRLRGRCRRTDPRRGSRLGRHPARRHNGPGGLSLRTTGLQRRRPGGGQAPCAPAACWRSGPRPATTFTKRLKRAGYAVEEIGVQAHKGRGARHDLAGGAA